MRGEYKRGQLPELWDGRAAERIIDILGVIPVALVRNRPLFCDGTKSIGAVLSNGIDSARRVNGRPRQSSFALNYAATIAGSLLKSHRRSDFTACS